MSKLNRLMHRGRSGRSRDPRLRTTPKVVEDKTTPFAAPPDLFRWDVVMLSPAANDGTLARIDAAGFDVWRPRTVVLITAARVGASVYVNRPLWPRYAFVARRDATMNLSDVWSIGKPLIVGSVSGAVVDAIATREGMGEFDCRSLPKAGEAFDRGANVETMDGLMRGIVLKSDEQRTVVLFRILDAEREVQVETRRLKRTA